MINKKIILGIGGLVVAGGGVVTTVLLLKKDKDEAAKTQIDHSKLLGSSFESSGGSVGWKTSVAEHSDKVEIKYSKYTPAKGETPEKWSKYQTEKLTGLSNNDKIRIKFFIKEEHVDTHKFSKNFYNPIEAVIKNGALVIIIDDTNIVTNFVNDSFEFSGGDTKGTIKSKENKFPEGVKVEYQVGSATVSGGWSTAPVTLTNGNKVWYKLSLESGIYELPSGVSFPAAKSIDVSGLKTLVAHNLLVSGSFEVDSDGAISKKSGANIPAEVEYRFWKDTDKDNAKASEKDSDYKDTLSGLEADDVVWIKFSIKKDSVESHAFDSQFSDDIVQFTVPSKK